MTKGEAIVRECRAVDHTGDFTLDVSAAAARIDAARAEERAECATTARGNEQHECSDPDGDTCLDCVYDDGREAAARAIRARGGDRA